MSHDPSFYNQETIRQKKERHALPPIPKQIGPYKIESHLSKGGMSILYLGIHPETEKNIVVKVLSPQFVTHPESIKHFLKESEIITLADHPNIVKLYGQGEWEGGLYLAMQFVRGVSLRQFILQHSLSLKRSLEIVLQVSYALCHLHTHGIIHRDLKPENILIPEDGEVKVIDFGIAQLHEESPSTEGFMGTPNYMSPEQKENPKKVSFQSDIYALGIIAYELILGKLSYGVINVSLLPEQLRPIIEKAIAPKPKERYPDIVDFITEISNYIKSEAIEKDRTHDDNAKELLEKIYAIQSQYSPSSAPKWVDVEVGIKKLDTLATLGLYYDFFTLSDHRYATIIAEASTSGIEGAMQIAQLRGMIHTLIESYTNAPAFINALNTQLAKDHITEKFGLSLLVVDAIQGRFSFTSCGQASLLHFNKSTGKTRILSSENSKIGEDLHGEFFENSDSFNEEDILCLHSPHGTHLQTLADSEEELSIHLTELPSLSIDNIAEKLQLGKTYSPSLLLAFRHTP